MSRPLILMYHGFTDKRVHSGIENNQGKHLYIDVFSDQMEYLRDHCNPMSLEKLGDHIRKGQDIPEGTVVITIDDGYESNYRLAYPVLKKMDIPATIFITTSFVEERGPIWVDRLEYAINSTKRDKFILRIDSDEEEFSLINDRYKGNCERAIRKILKRKVAGERDHIISDLEERLGKKLSLDSGAPDLYRPLDWSQVSQMARSGSISIGSHGRDHVIITSCDGDTIKDEICGSKKIIEERTGTPCRSFCYPNGDIGDFSGRTKALLKHSGYSSGIINIPGFIDKNTDLFELNRFGLGKKPDMNEFKSIVSGKSVKKLIAIKVKSAWLRRKKREERSREENVIKEFDSDADKYAGRYQGRSIPAHSFTVRREKVYELLEDIEPGNILDIGCGPGIMVDYLARKGFKVYGVDISEEMIGQCKAKFSGTGSAHFSVGKIEKLDFPDSFFDVVICMGVVEYIDDDTAAISEMARVLKPGGVAIITLPNSHSPYRIWYKIVCNKYLIDLVKKVLGRKSASLIHREYKLGEYDKMLKSCGLKTRDIVYYNFNLFFFPLDKIFPLIASLAANKMEGLSRSRLRWLGTGFIVKVKK